MKLHKSIFILAAICMLFTSHAFAVKKAKPRLLVFSKTAGFRHDCIPAGKTAFLKMGLEKNFDVDTTEDASVFTAKNLKRYKAVVFFCTTGNVLDNQQQKAMEDYIHNGGGFVGIHAATDTEYDWPWYNQLVGAYFLSHPEQQTATLQVIDRNHPATEHLDSTWVRKDEWYNFKNIVPGQHVLLMIDESTYKGGENGKDHPMSWCRDFDGGRTFYTGLGHTKESYTDPVFLQHLYGGIRYVLEKKK